MLREIVLGDRLMTRVGRQPWKDIYCGLRRVEADGWSLIFYIDRDTLDYYDSCQHSDGRTYTFDSSPLKETDPVERLSSMYSVRYSESQTRSALTPSY